MVEPSELKMHPLADIFPRADAEQFEELVGSIKENGLRHPITLLEGKVLDGRHRLEACARAGVAPQFVDYDGDDPQAFVVDENVRRRHMNPSQLAMVAAELVTAKSGAQTGNRNAQKNGAPKKESRFVTVVDASKMMGVSPSTVAAAAKVKTNGSQQVIDAVRNGTVRVGDAVSVVAAPKREQDAALKRMRTNGDRTLAAAANKHTHASAYAAWHTPANIIEAARTALGGIDVDPASNPVANEVVRADTFYTVESDGLAQQWHGRVFLNPPYSAKEVGLFVAKLIEELNTGRATSAILLVNNSTETVWAQAAFAQASAVCFPKGRLAFLQDGKLPGAPLQGQAVFYFGKAPARFRKAFENTGAVVCKC